jgi:DNA-binding transcriptional MerR regulator
MYTGSLLSEIIMELFARMIGLDKKTIIKIFKKNNTQENEIENNFIEIKTKLNESQEIIETVLADVEKQMITYEQKKNEAILSENIANLNKAEVEAINKLLAFTVSSESKKSNAQNIIWGAIFCITSALLGFWLGKTF